MSTMTGHPFDSVAETYDADVDGNPVLALVRAELHREMRRHFKPGDRLLELGCGTGTDALFLARLGCSILAVDPSSAMLQTAAEKLRQAQLETRVRFVQAEAHRLPTILDSETPASFDGIYSNLGALNCEATLRNTGEALMRVLRPGGRLFLSFMPPVFPWEIVEFLLRARPGTAFRRCRRGGVAVPLQDDAFVTYFHSAGSVRRSFAGTRRIDQRSLGLALPPPYRATLLSTRKRKLLLMRLERWFCRLPVLRSSGDHVLLVLQKPPV